MPYIVHPKDSEPTDKHARYTSRAEAYRDLSDGYAITFVISEKERIEWKMREYRRFTDGIYSLPPWIDTLYRCWEPCDNSNSLYRYPALALHFAHLSLKTPGCIAYTRTDEDGYQDKQITIKVGRYLEEHAKAYFTPQQIAEYVDMVKGYSHDLQLAITAEEIETAYRGSHESVGSCMSHSTSEYRTGGIHPTAVYGNSDLALAYLGSLESPTARCIVWPAKKRYTRVYGDTTLKVVMEKAGYMFKSGAHYGDLTGAKVRAIKIPGRSGYVMPYIDAACSADLRGGWFILHNDDSGAYDVHNADNIDGVARLREDEEHALCANCLEECEHDGDTYCTSCDEDRVSCGRCSDDFFDSSCGEVVGDSWYCHLCVSTHYSHECDGCERTWNEVIPESSYCEHCRDYYTSCDECSEYFDTRGCNDPDHDHCDECYTTPEDENVTSDEDGQSAVLAPIPLRYPIIDDQIGVALEHGFKSVDVLYRFGAIVVHLAIEDGVTGYSITHALTGRLLTRESEIVRAVDLAQLFSTPGLDWNFRSETESSTTTREVALYIVRNRALPLGNCPVSRLLRAVNPSLFPSEDVCPV